MVLALFLLLSPQQDDATRIRALVEKLGSELVTEREEAVLALKGLGKAAAGELRKAAEESHLEKAALAKTLLKRLQVLEPVSPRLLRDFPGETERLVSGIPADWTALFLEAEYKREPGTRLPLYSRDDVEGLAAVAIRGAEPWQHLITVLQSIARRGIRSADAPLMELFEHPERDVREAAAKSITLSEPVVRRLIALTGSEREDVRRFAIETLGSRRVREANDALSKLARDKNGEVRRHAIQALGRIRGQDAVPDLEAWLKDPHSTVRVIALQALNDLYARESGPAIEKLLDDSESFVRQEALRTLGQLRIRAAAPKVAKLLEGPDRISALQCLRDLEAKEAAAQVAASLLSSNEEVRGQTLVVLAGLDPSRAIEPALQALESKDRYSRGQAAMALAIAKSKEGIPGIRKLLKDETQFVRESAAMTLAILDAREAIPDLMAGLDVETERDRKEMLLALGKLGAKGEAEKIRGMLKSTQPWVRFGALKCLDALEAIRTDEVEALLADPNLWPKREAIEVLARRRGRDAASKIRPFIHDLHPWACMAALDALARIEDWGAATEIERLLGDLDLDVRRAAAGWLAKSGSRAGLAVFIEDVEAPLFALNALRSPEVWKRLSAESAPGKTEGTGPERIVRLAAAAGLKVDEGAKPRGRMARWLEGSMTWPFDPGISLAGALELMTRDAPYCLILEADKVRIVTREEAHRFWRSWLEESEPKK